jgi:hypothetical protein
MMQLGCDGVFVGSGIFKSGDPAKRARAIVEATTHFEDAGISSRRSRATSASRWSASTSRISRMPSGCRNEAGSVRIGVLALQGAFREHILNLESLGVRATAVRLPSQLPSSTGS